MIIIKQERPGADMIDRIHKSVYFQMTFNEQMSWPGEEVEHIIKDNETCHIKQKIQQQGRPAIPAR